MTSDSTRLSLIPQQTSPLCFGNPPWKSEGAELTAWGFTGEQAAALVTAEYGVIGVIRAVIA